MESACEEEVGSPHFAELLRDQGALFGDVRAVLVSDTLWVSAETHYFDDPARPIREQGGERKVVTIGAGAWVGTGAIVLADS